MMIPTLVPSFDGFYLFCNLYECESPKILVQIVHGVVEYKGRYDAFARYLVGCGCCTLVCDQRGHGQSIDGHFTRGYMPKASVLVEDQKAINQALHDLHPDVPLVMIAHSFGSNIARMYLKSYDWTIDGLIMSGPPCYVPGIGIGLAVVKLLIRLLGERGYGFISSKLTTSASLKWVCSDPTVIEQRRTDPYIKNFRYQLAAIQTIFESVKALHESSSSRQRNHLLPILCLSGSDDPIPGGPKGLADTCDSLQKLGYQEVTSHVFENMRHEVLNELNKKIVYQMIITFMDALAGKSS